MGKSRKKKLKWLKSKLKMPIFRKPIAPPTKVFKSKKGYDRKRDKEDEQ